MHTVPSRDRLVGGGEPAAVAQARLGLGALGVRHAVAGAGVGTAARIACAALRGAALDETTPLEALQLLAKLQQQLGAGGDG